MLTNLRTPLRYPGGKKKLADFVECLISSNGLEGCEYIEPFAGGAGLAIELLKRGVVSSVWLNDIDKGIAAFWNTILENPEEFCQLVEETPVTVDEWFRQKEVFATGSGLKKGFAVFFLNRTNRSGILKAGVIGGKRQDGKWKLDCRYNKSDLISRIRAIAACRERIHFFNEDALTFIHRLASRHQKSVLFNLDPPYYVKGAGLYLNAYSDQDHIQVARTVRKLKVPWIVSYDNHDFIRTLYSGFPFIEYDLSYSAHLHTTGKEILFMGNINDHPDSVGNIGHRVGLS